MSDVRAFASQIAISVENVGGIDKTKVEFSPGVTILAGRNTTNRTSLLRAIMAALGSDNTALKGDAEKGTVKLVIDDNTYTRSLIDNGGQLELSGDPYLTDPQLADLFAFLLEENEARDAVRRGGDLRDLVMRPVDTDAIESQVDDFVAEKHQIDNRLEKLDQLEDEMTHLEKERARLDSEIGDIRAKLDKKQAELDEVDRNVEETREEKEIQDEKLSELQEVRSRLDQIGYSLETERESLDSLRNERKELEEELSALAETPGENVEKLEHRIERLRGRKESIDKSISDLKGIIQFNEKTLEGENNDVIDLLTTDDNFDASVTDQIVENGGSTSCWTCGSDVEMARFAETLTRLRKLHQQKFNERSEIQSDIDELRSNLSEYKREQARREEVKRNLDKVVDEIENREENVKNLNDNRDDIRAEVEQLEAEVSELRDDAYTAILDLHKESNQLEFQLERRKKELSDVEDRIQDTDDQLEERVELKKRREELQANLEDLRTRVDSIEQGAIEAFNEHMENVLEILNYTNVERIWIERTETGVREGRGNVTKRQFDLHLIRSSASGTSYRDSVGHLSESEREVMGLVFALAGYLVHDVYEEVPFVLLDSLEAIDSGRIATLLDYLTEYVDNLVVALLPEDADELPAEYEYVSSI